MGLEQKKRIELVSEWGNGEWMNESGEEIKKNMVGQSTLPGNLVSCDATRRLNLLDARPTLNKRKDYGFK